MSQCPFHAESVGNSERGEIESIQCPACGSYRISKTALEALRGAKPPSNWAKLVSQRAIISTRDTRSLAS